MDNKSNYFLKRDEENIFKIRELRLELPSFVVNFYGNWKPNNFTYKAWLCQRFKNIFEFLVTNTQEFYGKKISELTLTDLNNVTSTHLEMFLDYLTVYKVNGKTYRNGLKGKGRKLSSVRALLKYFFKKKNWIAMLVAKLTHQNIEKVK